VSDELRLPVPDEFIETIAERTAELVLAALTPPEWLTLDEAADRYRTTSGALRWRAQHDRLPGAVKDGSRWLVNAREMDRSLGYNPSTRTKKRGPRRRNGRAPGTGGISSHA